MKPALVAGFSVLSNLVDKDIRMYNEWLGCEIVELNVQADHVHVVVSIPPKISVSTYMGTIKGKIAIKIFKSYPEEETILGKSFLGKRIFCEHSRNQ